ncbi:hypothetical protein H0H81_011197 [Sphagnurus paluster]|uniref:Uncharacterized protein n=1 Tax=Sphagnurus paluster TaxID=117069 RepID=A0A9P7FWQ8_9AGAR|nr:hypothetical protein H0H81_011197 [Sphagnurus paluster]
MGAGGRLGQAWLFTRQGAALRNPASDDGHSEHDAEDDDDEDEDEEDGSSGQEGVL